MQTFFLASSSAGLLLLRTYVHQQGCKSKERVELSNLRKNCETLLVIAKKLLLKQAQFFVQEIPVSHPRPLVENFCSDSDPRPQLFPITSA